MIDSKKLKTLNFLLEEYKEYKEQKLNELKENNIEDDSSLLDITFEIVNIENMIESIEASIEEETSIEDKVQDMKDNLTN